MTCVQKLVDQSCGWEQVIISLTMISMLNKTFLVPRLKQSERTWFMMFSLGFFLLDVTLVSCHATASQAELSQLRSANRKLS